MRVSTSGMFTQGVQLMQRLQAALDHTQRQVSSGRRILTPSDDPIAAARALEIRESISRLDQFDRNANIAQNRLAQEESALSSVNNVLQRVRELALQANNASQGNESRHMIAVEMRQQLDNLVQLANQKDGNGKFLFSGNMDDVEPVIRGSGGFAYSGDQGQRTIQIGEGRQIAEGDSGAAVFFAIRNGNGNFYTQADAANTGTGVLGGSSMTGPTVYAPQPYTLSFVSPSNYEIRSFSGTLVETGPFSPSDTISFRGHELTIDGQPVAGDQFLIAPSINQDMFTGIEQLIGSVEADVHDDITRTATTNGINAGLQNLDQAIGNVLDVRTQVGARLVAIDDQVDSNGAFALNYQDTLASLEDLDYAEALSRLSMEVTTLEAAQQSFVRTQSLSLFNYF